MMRNKYYTPSLLQQIQYSCSPNWSLAYICSTSYQACFQILSSSLGAFWILVGSGEHRVSILKCCKTNVLNVTTESLSRDHFYRKQGIGANKHWNHHTGVILCAQDVKYLYYKLFHPNDFGMWDWVLHRD